MALDSTHPLYAEQATDWRKMRHAYKGERAVKEEGTTYLPPTSGMVADGMHTPEAKGSLAYRAYKMRARFPDYVKKAVTSLLGVMHHKPPVIELPASMEYLRDRATVRGESLAMLLQRMNEEQLVPGRCGLLGDVIDRGPMAGKFMVALYKAEDVTNWDDGGIVGAEVENLNLVVLNESQQRRVPSGFEWEHVRKYRVLLLGELEEIATPDSGAVYRVGEFDDTDTYSEGALFEPSVMGRRAQEIPFVFVNAVDIVPEPTEPPLLGLADLCFGIYRGEADYRQSLYMQGQDTLVITGGMQQEGEDVRVGSGARIDLQIGGDAKYIGVDSTGLSEQREALQNDKREAMQDSGQLLDSVSRERESGDALKVRVAARTATLNRVALAGAFALQELLRKLAKWAGANPDEVLVTPNLDFVDDTISGEEVSQWMGAKMIGAPLSLQTIHEMLQARGVTEMTFEEELARIAEERENETLQPIGSSNQDGPVDDQDDDEPPADEQDDEQDDDAS